MKDVRQLRSCRGLTNVRLPGEAAGQEGGVGLCKRLVTASIKEGNPTRIYKKDIGYKVGIKEVDELTKWQHRKWGVG